MGPTNGITPSNLPPGHSALTATDRAPDSNRETGDSLRKITPARPEGFFRNLWRRLSGTTPLQERDVQTGSPPLSYQKFRSAGFGVSGPVNLVHKTAVVQPEVPPVANAPSANPLDNIEAVLARARKMTQIEPDKVPGIRQTARKHPAQPLSASALLAKKTYAVAASSAEADTEYRLLQKLEHPNIVRLKDSEISSELQNGQPVTHITLFTESGIANLGAMTRTQLPAKDIAKVMKQMVDGLEYLHDQKITHNDLKPHNVILMPDMTAKLIDFGSAADFSGTAPRQYQGAVGTPGYRAPDIEGQIESGACDFTTLQKGDYWGAGCVLYELMTGTQYHDTNDPYPDDWQQHLDRQLAAIPEPMEGWNPEAIKVARQALRELLHCDPEQRSLDALKRFSQLS